MALVVLVHAVAFWWVAYRVPMIASRPAADDNWAVQVDLRRRLPGPPSEAPTASPRPRGPADQIVGPPAAAPRVTASVAPPNTPLTSAAPPEPTAAQDEAVRRAMRGLVGCADPDVYKLSPEERRQCFRNARQAAPLPHTLDPKEQAAFDADAKREPWLFAPPTTVANRAWPINPFLLARRSPAGAGRPCPPGSRAGSTARWRFSGPRSALTKSASKPTARPPE